MCKPPPIGSSATDGRTDSFSSFILSSSTNLFILGDFNCHHLFWDSRGTSEPCGEEAFDWIIFSNLLPSMTLTYPPFFIALLAVFLPVTFSLSPPLLLFLAPGSCFRTWVLTTYQFSIFLSVPLSGLLPQRASSFLQLSEKSMGWLCLLL